MDHTGGTVDDNTIWDCLCGITLNSIVEETWVNRNTISDCHRGILTIARYESQPFPDEEFPDEALGKYIDIHVSNPKNVTWPIHVEVSYTDAEVSAAGIGESSPGSYYYESVDTLHRCSNTG